MHLAIGIVLLVAVSTALAAGARRFGLSEPLVLTLAGIVGSYLWFIPDVSLSPQLVLLGLLPPLLYTTAIRTSLVDFRANRRPIALLSIGLVLFSTFTAGLVVWWLLPVPFSTAVALGAVVAPPDAVSATAVARRVGMPRRIVTILEGESLVNDATALVLYRAAVAAAVSGGFVVGEALFQFVYAAVAGVVVGVLVGWVTRWALHVIGDSFTEIAATLLAPYVAWVIGESIHASAVLSCVAGGIYLRQHFSKVVAPTTRLQGRAVWDLVVIVLNGVIFILIGLQLGTLGEAVPPDRLWSLMIGGTLISVAAIVVRLGWVPLIATIPRYLSSTLRARDPLPPWPHIFLVAWTGMRGIVTLAAAMALPVSTGTGAPFPFRSEIILLSFMVILATLVLQGLTLAPLIRTLGVSGGSEGEEEEMHAREQAAGAALVRLNELTNEDWTKPAHVEQLELHYGGRLRRFSPDAEIDPDCKKETSEAFLRLREATLAAERSALIRLRDEGTISDEVLHRLEQEVDVEALRLGIGERRMHA